MSLFGGKMMRIKYVLVVLVGLTSVFASAQDYSTRPVNNCVYRGGLDSAYQQCTQAYNTAITNYNTFHSTTTGLQAPRAPNYSSCNRTDSTTGAVSQDGTCRQQLDSTYQQQLQTYNEVKRIEAESQRRQQIEQQQAEAARQAAQQAQSANKKAGSQYGVAQIFTAVASVVAFSMCGPQNPGACAVGAFMAAQSLMAGTQKASHATGAYQSCMTGNSYGASQANCGSSPAPFNPTGFPNNTEPPLNTLVDANGNCTASVELCNDLRSGLPPGTTLNDLARGLSNFASAKPPAKVDANGNILTKDGKKFGPGSLDDLSDLKAAGLSGDQAAALLAAAGKAGTLGDGAAGTAKANGLDSLSGLDGLGEDSAGKSAAAGGAGNGSADGSEFDADKNKRKIAAAEGLAKDFNGELIGVAGDDIFKMMNRRYVLKVKQDSFMAP